MAKRLSVESWTLWMEADPGVPAPDPRLVLFEGLPVVNWFSPKSQELLLAHEDAKLIQIIYTLNGPQEFSVAGDRFLLEKIGGILHCKKSWHSRLVRQDATLGEYDHLKGVVRVPSGHGYLIRPFSTDGDGWHEIDGPGQDADDVEPNIVALALTRLNPIHPVPDVGMPAMDRVVASGAMFKEMTRPPLDQVYFVVKT